MAQLGGDHHPVGVKSFLDRPNRRNRTRTTAADHQQIQVGVDMVQVQVGADERAGLKQIGQLVVERHALTRPKEQRTLCVSLVVGVKMGQENLALIQTHGGKGAAQPVRASALHQRNTLAHRFGVAVAQLHVHFSISISSWKSTGSTGEL